MATFYYESVVTPSNWTVKVVESGSGKVAWSYSHPAFFADARSGELIPDDTLIHMGVMKGMSDISGLETALKASNVLGPDDHLILKVDEVPTDDHDEVSMVSVDDMNCTDMPSEADATTFEASLGGSLKSILTQDKDLLGDDKEEAMIPVEYDPDLAVDDTVMVKGINVPDYTGSFRGYDKNGNIIVYNKVTGSHDSIRDKARVRKLTGSRVIKGYPEAISYAIQNNLYVEWIREGRMTLEDAKAIISSAKLEIPTSLIDETAFAKGGSTEQANNASSQYPDMPDEEEVDTSKLINNLMAYGKHKDDLVYKAMDVSEWQQVSNLVYASLIHPSKFNELKSALIKVKEKAPEWEFKIVDTGTKKELFSTEPKELRGKMVVTLIDGKLSMNNQAYAHAQKKIIKKAKKDLAGKSFEDAYSYLLEKWKDTVVFPSDLAEDRKAGTLLNFYHDTILKIYGKPGIFAKGGVLTADDIIEQIYQELKSVSDELETPPTEAYKKLISEQYYRQVEQVGKGQADEMLRKEFTKVRQYVKGIRDKILIRLMAEFFERNRFAPASKTDFKKGIIAGEYEVSDLPSYNRAVAAGILQQNQAVAPIRP